MTYNEIVQMGTDILNIFFNKIVLLLGIFFSIIFYITGGKDKLMTCLLILMGVDYVTGVIKAFVAEKPNSKKGFKGILKKIVTICVVVLAYQIDILLDNKFSLRYLTLCILNSNEGLSILENAAVCGVPIPERLKNVLEQYKDFKKDKQRE
ncbi:holin family protein [Fusobacterium varium]|uniref:phage holin family protein n=1 Tax=Fusobacterium varium TaxID=856 RepID=UPI0035697DB0